MYVGGLCVGMYAHEFRFPQRPEKSDPPGARVKDLKLPAVGSKN